MTGREKIADRRRLQNELMMIAKKHWQCDPLRIDWNAWADAILALFEDTIKDAERWRIANEEHRILPSGSYYGPQEKSIDAAKRAE